MIRARFIFVVLVSAFCAGPVLALDPPYQPQMERLAEVMGSLYFLEPLCGNQSVDWRAQASELIALDRPEEDRRQRLAGAFNEGYKGFARTYRACTASAKAALARLLTEAEKTARDIHARFAE